MTTNAIDEKNLIKVRQICFIYLAFMPVNKFIFLPANLAALANEQFWVSLAVNFVIDGLILWAILLISEKKGNEVLYYSLERSFGKPVSKGVYLMLALYFLIKSVIPIFEHKAYIERTLYEMLPQNVIFFTFFIVSAYLCFKGLKILGRCADFAIIFTALGLAVGLFLSVGYADYSNLLPIFQKPAYKLVNASLRTTVWHCDSMYMFLIIGHFRPEKLYKTKITASYFIGALVTIFCIVTFYGVYGAIAPSQNYAFSAVSVFSVIVTNIGRFDFLSIFLVLFSEVFAIAMPLVFAAKCLKRVFSAKNSLICAIAVNAVILIITWLFAEKLYSALELYGNYFIYIFAVVLLITLLAFSLSAKRRDNAVYQN